VVEAILGESSSAGLLGGGNDLNLDSGMECDSDDQFKLELLRTAHRRLASMKKFLEGDYINMAVGDDDYTMIFEKKDRKSSNSKLRNKKPDPAMEEEPEECDFQLQ
jgi:hypothetical protein